MKYTIDEVREAQRKFAENSEPIPTEGPIEHGLALIHECPGLTEKEKALLETVHLMRLHGMRMAGL